MLNRLFEEGAVNSEARLDIWRESRSLLGQFFVSGAGLLGFNPLFLRYQAVINAHIIDFAHNDFLQYAIELGVVGFGSLIASLGGLIWPVLRLAWGISSPNRVLLGGAAAGLAAVAGHSFVDFNLYIPANVFAFAWLLGWGSGLAEIKSAGKADDLEP
jgi:O-antigen ligase